MSTTIYALRKGGSFVYVGLSRRFPGRIRDHRQAGKRFDDAVVLAEVPAHKASAVERAAIDTYRPILNCTHGGTGGYGNAVTGIMAVRVSDSLYARIRAVKASTNQTESALIRVALEEFLDRHNSPAKIISAIVASVQRGA